MKPNPHANDTRRENLESGFARYEHLLADSPTTLYASLQTILLSLESQKIAGKTAEVFTLLKAVQKDYDKLNENFGLLGKHLTNAFNTLNLTSQTMNQIGNKLGTTKDLKTSLLSEKSDNEA